MIDFRNLAKLQNSGMLYIVSVNAVANNQVTFPNGATDIVIRIPSSSFEEMFKHNRENAFSCKRSNS